MNTWPELLLDSLQARDSWERHAVVSGETKLTYRDFVSIAGNLKVVLRDKFGIKRGSRVIVAFDDSASSWLDFGALQLAIGCLGGCFSVIDTRSKSLSQDAREHVVKLFAPDLFIMIGDVDVPPISALKAPTVNFPELLVGGDSVLEFPLTCEATLSDGAFVDWTSGSTGGLPKGCVCTHETLAKMYMQKCSCEHGFLKAANLPVVGFNLFFLWYWWQPLCHGGTSVFLLDSEIRDLSLFTAAVERNKISAIDCITPSLLKVIVRHYKSEYFPSTILVSGEALPLELCESFLDRFPDKNLINVFSTTETGDAGISIVSQELITESVQLGLTACPIDQALLNVEFLLRPVSGEPEDPDVGELIVLGVGAKEYIGDPQASKKGFDSKLGWLSRDRAKKFGSKNGFAILGRLDDCVKVRGFKIDLKSIEETSLGFGPEIKDAVALVDNRERICLFLLVNPGMSLDVSQLKQALHSKLSASHWPQIVEIRSEFPLTRTGKLDKKSLLNSLALDSQPTSGGSGNVLNPTLVRVLEAFSQVGLGTISDPNASFWDLGGTSLMAISLCHLLEIPASEFLDLPHPSPLVLSALLEKDLIKSPETKSSIPKSIGSPTSERGVAIIGMAGRWPRTDRPSDAMTASDLIALLKQEFVPLSTPPHTSSLGNIQRGFYLDQSLVEGFDLGFWKTQKISASKFDPHQRLFLEMAYEALVDAGSPDVSSCGVFAAGGSLSHFTDLLLNEGESLETIRETDPARYLEIELGCDKDYVALRAAKLLNCRGPAVTVQAACASALVAVVQAVNAIRANQCETAIAGGVSLVLPQSSHAGGLIWASDGICRPFDAKASGTANCNGGHCFVLKRMDLAIKDGDSIYAEILGVGLNNDGSRGKDFVAPSVSGHKQAIVDALADANIKPSEVTLIEAHGTGTLLGDPMEYAALSAAYRGNDDGKHINSFLRVGSVKGNVGHANTAAGALGLAKAAVCVYEKTLVKSGSFESINPHISVNPLVRIQDRTEEWIEERRIAGISSLGMGGTNCHVVIAQPNDGDPHSPSTHKIYDSPFLVSAHSENALKNLVNQVHAFVNQGNPNISWEDVAYTFAHERPSLAWRKSIKQSSDFSALGPFELVSRDSGEKPERVVLMFPGQGVDALPSSSQFACDPAIIEILGFDPLARAPESSVWFQVSIFAVSYTLGKQAVALLPPDVEIVCVGHSLGEYAAAAVANRIRLSDAIKLVVRRAELLVEHTTAGCMAAVSASEPEVIAAIEKLGSKIEIACINREDRIVVSGIREDVESFVQLSGSDARIVKTIGAFHSRLADPVKTALENYIVDERIEFLAPGKIKLVSTFTGEFVSNRLTPEHWGAHTRHCVRMTEAFRVIAEDNKRPTGYVNVGPGITMSQLLKKRNCVTILGNDFTTRWDIAASLWELGLVDAEIVIPKQKGKKRVLGLPTVGWDRTICWPTAKQSSPKIVEKANKRELFYQEKYVQVNPVLTKAIAVKSFDRIADEWLSKMLIEEGKHICIDFRSLSGKSVGAEDPQFTETVAEAAKHAIALIQRILKIREQDRIIRIGISFLIPIGELLGFSGLVGLVRCAMSEHPDLNISLVSCGDKIPKKFPISVGEFEYREKNSWWGRRLVSAKHLEANRPLAPGGKYIVTGGLGGIGQALVSWLLDEKSASEILILARRPGSHPNAKVRVVEVNLDDPNDVKEKVDAFTDVNGIFHLAGTVHDSLVSKIDLETCTEQIVSGKLKGLVSLFGAIPDVPVFVFSTSSAMLGSPGQGLYAAANAAVDAIVLDAKNNGRHAVSLQWGGWEASVANSMSARFGLRPIEGCERYFSASTGFEAMEKCIQNSESAVVGICDIYDWNLYAEKTQISLSQISLLLPQVSESNWIPSEEQLMDPNLRWIRDHSDGQILIPATGILGGLFSTVSKGKGLKNVRFSEPVRLGRFYSVDQVGETVCMQSWVPHSETKSINATAEIILTRELTLTGKRLLWVIQNPHPSGGKKMNVERMYRDLASGGFEYGPSFRLVKKALRKDNIVFAEIDGKIDEKCFVDGKIFWALSPVLDACTHVASLLDDRASSAFPAKIGHVSILDSARIGNVSNLDNPPPRVWSVVMEMKSNEMSNEVIVDMLAIGEGKIVVFESLVLVPVSRKNDQDNILCLSAGSPGADFETVVQLENEAVIPAPVEGPFEIVPAGSNLEVHKRPLPSLRPLVEKEKIRVEVDKFGLSFLDILATTGVMPASMFGGEFAGTVIAVGSKVSAFKPGDRVACLCSGGFRSVMDVNASFSVILNQSFSYEKAATVPVSFCTALFALERAQVKPGMTILVHNASGALGMAVIALAKKRFKKVKIIGTCSKGKIDFVKNLGVSQILDSRDVSSWPHAMFVDVSIGAMHPDLLEATIPMLKSFGTIVDVGKRLQVENVQLGLSPFVRGLTYTTAHLDELMRVDPPRVKTLMEAAFKAGESLPFQELSIDQIGDALRFLSSGSHTGKVIVRLGQASVNPPIESRTLVVKDNVGLDAIALGAVRNAFSNREKLTIKLFNNLSSKDEDTENTLWVESSCVAHVAGILNRIPLSPRSMSEIAILPESKLMGPEPVKSRFRTVRKALLSRMESSTTMGQSERDWLYQAIAKLIGEKEVSEEQESASFESLGIDSLGRLQLWHSFKRQFPLSKFSSSFSGSTCLKSFFSEPGAVKQSGKRWLAIHGFRTNAVVIQHQLGELVRELGPLELLAVQASQPARGPCPDGIEEGYEWWSNPAAVSYHEGWIGSQGLERSVEEIEKFVRENGPFDCVVGFSQGGGMAHYLVSKGLVSKGVLFSPVLPKTDLPWITDENDNKVITVFDEADKTVGTYPMQRMQIFTHHEGHKIPPLSPEIIAAIRAL